MLPISLVLAYLIGSISFSYIIGKVYGLDIRRVGSGNPGASNIGRILGWKIFLLVFTLDATKGAAAILIGWHFDLNMWEIMLVALAVIIGHLFPVFLSFKGGKGVATGAGIFITLNPWALVIALAAWILIVWATKYISLASIFAALVVLTVQLSQADPWVATKLPVTMLSIVLALAIFITHIPNIKRLARRNENKVDFAKFFKKKMAK